VFARVSAQYENWIKPMMKDFKCISDDDCIRGSFCYIGQCVSGVCAYRADPKKLIRVDIEFINDQYQKTSWMINLSLELQVAKGGPYGP